MVPLCPHAIRHRRRQYGQSGQHGRFTPRSGQCTPIRLTPEEAAFYAALAKNESAVDLLGNKQLLVIASELVRVVREKSAVDWWRRENVRTAMRVAVKRLLKRYGYPPDLQDDAVKLVLRQAEALAQEPSRAA